MLIFSNLWGFIFLTKYVYCKHMHFRYYFENMSIRQKIEKECKPKEIKLACGKLIGLTQLDARCR